MSKGKELTWDELADVYDRCNAGRARTKSLDTVFDWAVSRKDLFTKTKSGSLILKRKGHTHA